jgi:hypothetical protein
MTTGQAFANWLNQLETSQQVFAAGRLDKTLAYLRRARTPGQAWGPYPGLGSDIYHSALAIQALSYADDQSATGIIGGAAAYLREVAAERLDELSIDELSGLLSVARCEQRPGDDDYIQQLISSIRKKHDALMESNDEPSVRVLASALLAVVELGRMDLEIVKGWSERLLSRQCADGSWPIQREESGSVIPTAIALRVFNRLSDDKARDAVSRGLRFLESCLREKGWQELGTGGDTFTKAIVLRALAEIPATEYKCIQDGTHALIDQVNPDGSWGGGRGEAGNIEGTALSLLALVAAGENRFVPARLAMEALTDFQRQLNQIGDERDTLRQDLEKRVQDDCGRVVKERNELLKENKDLKEKLQAGQDEIQRAKEEAEFALLRLERELRLMAHSSLGETSSARQLAPSATWPEPIRWLLNSNVTVAAAGLVFLSTVILLSTRLWSWPFEWKPSYTTYFLIFIFVPVLAFMTATIVNYFARRNAMSRYYAEFAELSTRRDLSAVSFLRSEYFEMADEWPYHIREEVAYRIRELVDMSPDIGYRFAEELSFNLGLSGYQRSRLLRWVTSVLRLERTDRRVLFDQLQRTTLK